MSPPAPLPATAITTSDGTLPIDAARVVDSDVDLHWDWRCDVLVVGFGAAGASAAIAAHESGAKTVIVERFDGGGATARSGGIVYGGGGTEQQRRAGVHDTADAMFRYLQCETGDAVGEATLRRFCDDSRGLIAWLESLGVSFDTDADKLTLQPKTSYPKDGIYLYYSGNEAVREYAEVATPAPRGHRARGTGLFSGKSLFEKLRARVTALGVRVLPQSGVHRLVIDRANTVLGVELRQLPPGSKAAQQHRKLLRRAEAVHNVAAGWADRLRARALAIELAEAKTVFVRAQRGVVLSTGGFIFNRAMVAQHAAKFLAPARLGATGCDGSGIRLGASVGGVPARLDKVSAWRFINPPVNWPEGMVVNAQGERFCNEQVYGAKLGVQICEHQDGRAWLIIDRRARRAAIREALFGGLWAFQGVPALLLMALAPRGATAQALATKIGLPAGALQQSIERYNDGAHRKQDALGKSSALLKQMRGPFYALDISAANRSFPCPAITLGGLRINESNGAVIDADGKDIDGLYAAGRTAVGIASNSYISGLSIADCLWSGRRAGRAAAGADALQAAA